MLSTAYTRLGMFRGTVVGTDADTDKQQGKIKVEVYPYLMTMESMAARGEDGGMQLKDMPWAVPAYPLFSGAGNGSGFFTVPDIGTAVWVFFEQGDLHQPVYFAEAANGAQGLPQERIDGYPTSTILRTENGDLIAIRRANRAISINFNESLIEIDEDGNVNIKSKGEVRIN